MPTFHRMFCFRVLQKVVDRGYNIQFMTKRSVALEEYSAAKG